MKYLTDLPTDLLCEYGLQKTLFTRRDTIYMKHIFKNIFEYGDEYDLDKKLKVLQFPSLFKYMNFITHKLRGIYKYERFFEVENADDIVKEDRGSFCKVLELYKPLHPIVILDFDRTITNRKFHSLYKWLLEYKFKVIINSANPNTEEINRYMVKHDLDLPYRIYSNKGKQKKITKLKSIATSHSKNPIFYIDDEIEYLDYGVLLCMYCYNYRKDGKIKSYTFFQK